MATCKTCLKEFKSRNRSGRKSPTSSFCSKECYWKNMTILLDCKICGIKFKRKSNGVLKYCSPKCRWADNEVRQKNIDWHKALPKERFSLMGLKSVSSQDRVGHPTSIEKAVYDYLVLKEIVFEKQKIINGKFSVDAYIPSLNLVIECDGFYWHGLAKNIKRDRAKNAYLKKCGFNMIRLTEQEIKSGEFKERMVV